MTRSPGGGRQPWVAWRFAARAALAGAFGGGFLAAGLLGEMATGGGAADPAYRILAQAHGRAQAFGLGGLLALGIALHFLPRLRHAPLAWPRLANAAIGLVAGGLALRLGPALALLADDPTAARVAAFGAVVGALDILAGTVAGAVVLARTHVVAPGGRHGSAIAPIVPLVGAAWASLIAAQGLDVVGTIASLAGMTPGVVAPTISDAVSWLALPGWFVPLAVAFASRTFPLYLRTRPAPPGALRGWLVAFVGGLVLDLFARTGVIASGADGLGQAAQGAAILGWVHALGIWRARPPRPGRITDPGVRRAETVTGTASDVAILAACAWLAVAGAMLGLGGAATLAGVGSPPSHDAVRHAIGAGALVPLVVGMAIRLLPGFAGDRPDAVGRASAWVAAVAAVAAGVLRAGPGTAAWLAASGVPLGLAGPGTAWLVPAAAAGAAAVASLWWSLRRSLG